MNQIRQNNSEPEMIITPNAIGEVLWRRKWLVIIIVSLSLALAALVTINTPKRWRADAQMVLIQRAPNAVVTPASDYSSPIIEEVGTQVGMIESPAMAEHTIQWLKNQALVRGRSTASVQISPDALSNELTVFNPRDTSLLNISVIGDSPEQAATNADAVCHAFVQWKEDMARQDAVVAENSLDERAKRAKIQLQRAEQAETAYKVKSHMVDADPQERALIEQLQASDLNVTAAQQELHSAQARLKTLDAQLGDATAAIRAGKGVRDDALVQSLQASLTKAETDYASAKSVYTDKYPGQLAPMQANIAKLKQQLADAISNTLNNKAPSLTTQGALRDALLQAQVDTSVAQAKLTAASTARNQVQEQLTAFPRTFVTFNQLDQARLLASTLYTDLQAALNAARVDEDKIASDIQITQSAEVPDRPSQPNPVKYMVIGLFLGSLISVFLALLLEQRDQRIRNMPELRRLASGPIIALMPRLSRLQLRGTAQQRTLPDVQEAVSFAWVNLSRMLQQRGNGDFPALLGDHKTMLVTSAVPREGKSFVASNLAEFIAQTGKSVILVDANLHPEGRRKAKITTQPGLAEILQGKATVEESLFASDIPNLRVLSSGVGQANPVILLSQPGVQGIFDDLRAQADIVIIDAPDCTSVPDTALLASYADCLVQVVGINKVEAASMLDTSIALQSTNKPTVIFVNNAQKKETRKYRNQNLMFHHVSLALPAPTDATKTQKLNRSEINTFTKTEELRRADAGMNGHRRDEHEVYLLQPPSGIPDKNPKDSDLD